MKINFTGVESSSSVDPGRYPATVFSIEYKQSRKGNPMFEWSFAIQEGKFKGRKAFTTTSLVPAALFKLKGFIEVLEGGSIADDFDFDPQKYLGRPCEIKVVAQEGFGNSVDNIYKPKGAASPPWEGEESKKIGGKGKLF